MELDSRPVQSGDPLFHRGPCSRCEIHTLDGIECEGRLFCRPCVAYLVGLGDIGACPGCDEPHKGPGVCGVCKGALEPCPECNGVGVHNCTCLVRETPCPGCEDMPSVAKRGAVTWCGRCSALHAPVEGAEIMLGGDVASHKCYQAGAAREARDEGTMAWRLSDAESAIEGRDARIRELGVEVSEALAGRSTADDERETDDLRRQLAEFERELSWLKLELEARCGDLAASRSRELETARQVQLVAQELEHAREELAQWQRKASAASGTVAAPSPAAARIHAAVPQAASAVDALDVLLRAWSSLSPSWQHKHVKAPKRRK